MKSGVRFSWLKSWLPVWSWENSSTAGHQFSHLKNGDNKRTYIIGLLCRLNKYPADNKCSNINVIVCTRDQDSNPFPSQEKKHVNPCHLTHWVMVRLSLQLSKWFLVSLPQLAEPAVGWNCCAIQLEKQDLLTALLTPFVTGRCLMTSYSETGKEENAPEMTYCSDLLLIHLCLERYLPWVTCHFSLWIMSLPFS